MRTFRSRSEFDAATRRWPAPQDEHTILRDGTRIDTPEKGRAFLAEVAADLRAAQALQLAEQPDPDELSFIGIGASQSLQAAADADEMLTEGFGQG